MLILLSNEKTLCKLKVLITSKCWDYDFSGEAQWIPTQAHRLWDPCLYLYLLLLLSQPVAKHALHSHPILHSGNQRISKDSEGRYEHTNESSKPRIRSSSVMISLEKWVSASTPRHKQKVIENHQALPSLKSGSPLPLSCETLENSINFSQPHNKVEIKHLPTGLS